MKYFYQCLCIGVGMFFSSMNVSASPSSESRDMILEPAEEQSILIGVFGGINSNKHSGVYSLIDGNQPCCTFNDGSGIGPVLGIKAFIPLGDRLFFEPRLSYEERGGKLMAPTTTQNIRGKDNQIELGTFRNDLEASLPCMNIDLLAGYTLLKSIGLYVNGGLSVATLVSKSYVVYENILSPGDVFYTGTQDTRRETTRGDIEAARTLQLGIRVGLGANIRMMKRWYLNPEVLYHLPLTTYSSQNSSTWKSSILQPTLGISYQL